MWFLKQSSLIVFLNLIYLIRELHLNRIRSIFLKNNFESFFYKSFFPIGFLLDLSRFARGEHIRCSYIYSENLYLVLYH